MVEEEIKVPVASLAAVRARLAEHGAVLAEPAVLEENWVFDDAEGSLARSGRLLRLRRFGARTILTFKEAGRFEGGIKSRPEFETGLTDGDGGLAILAALGFVPARRYQKRREVWLFEGLQVALDETPMGAFVEVEGDARRLLPTARRLGLDPECAARGTYLDLWRAFRATHPDAPEDMIF